MPYSGRVKVTKGEKRPADVVSNAVHIKSEWYMSFKLPERYKPDEQWCDLAADYAVTELIAGKLVTPDQFDFAKRIVAQQLYVLLVSSCRPVDPENSD